MCIEMCKEKKNFESLTEKFIDKEYIKAKADDHYKIPIEIVFWVHRMNMPTNDNILGGSVYGTYFSFIELYEKLILKKDNK